jgi:hypothetical protein
MKLGASCQQDAAGRNRIVAHPCSAASVGSRRGSAGLPKLLFEVNDEGTQAVAPANVCIKQSHLVALVEAHGSTLRELIIDLVPGERGCTLDFSADAEESVGCLAKLQTLVLKGTGTKKMKFTHDNLPALQDLQLDGCDRHAANVTCCAAVLLMRNDAPSACTTFVHLCLHALRRPPTSFEMLQGASS